MKKFSKIVFWIVVYVGSIGFVLPELISASSNLALFGGFVLILFLIYKAITSLPTEKIKSFIKENVL